MKKVLILLAVAGLVGVLMSRGNGEDSQERGEELPPGRAQLQAKNTAGAAQQEGEANPGRPSVRDPDPAGGTRSKRAPAGDGSGPSAQPTPERQDRQSRDAGGDGVRSAADREGLSSSSGMETWLTKARKMIEKGLRVKAREVLTDRYLNSLGKERDQYRRLLDRLNRKLIFDPSCMAGATTHVLQRGETLSRVARKYGVNWRMIALLNGITNPARIRAGQKLKVLTGSPHLLVTKSEFTLTLLIDDYYVKEYPVGIGRNNGTPAGSFVVDNCLVEPDWYKPGGGVIKYGEPGHLLGDRWIGFQDKPGVSGYGIHGTNDPDSIGTECSRGCIRMRNEDVRELYKFVTPGVKVRIVE